MTLVSKLFIVDVDPTLRSLLLVDVGNLADVSEVYAEPH
jgi:hypothetical protein